MRKNFSVFLLLLLAGCGGEPAAPVKKAEAPKPAEPIGALSATYQAFNHGRTWSGDLQLLQVVSATLKEPAPEGGKYPAWRMTFVSPSKASAKPYTYSVVEGSGLYKGVFALNEQSYTPQGQTSPFLVQAFKTDSDAAFKTAMAKGADYAKKHPDVPITMLLEKTKQFPNPAWRVVWGTSVGTSSYSIFVDATTGDYLQTLR